ncbi:flavonol reductase [Aspergillus karnatakaensis]|uniref:flavonol reductase n=1 Tax=Aspergillus karnatakaensis TaxID=1810916 RepID=UPI003CCD68C0
MSLVLITGATGFIGSETALHVLKAGYRLRFVVRRPEQTAKLQERYAAYADQLEFAIVPDLTAPGCYDEPLKGVDYVLHLASPLPGGKETNLLRPAVSGTVSILHSALKVSTIKKVVITASILSLVPFGQNYGEDAVIKETFDVGNVTEEQAAAAPPMGQYHASKLASYKATIDFVREQKPAFDVVTLHPVLVYGFNRAQESAEQLGGTNGMLFQAIMTGKPIAGRFLGVHVEDVAAAHVRVLNNKVQGQQAFILGAPARSWEEVEAFVNERYPKLPVKLEERDGKGLVIDTSKAERELGLRFKGMEEQVGDLIDQQLAFRK